METKHKSTFCERILSFFYKKKYNLWTFNYNLLISLILANLQRCVSFSNMANINGNGVKRQAVCLGQGSVT